jgi:hypothetical protein
MDDGPASSSDNGIVNARLLERVGVCSLRTSALNFFLILGPAFLAISRQVMAKPLEG